MRSWWKVSKRGWAQWQTSLTQAYKNVFPDTTSASIQAVTTLRSSLSMYLFFVYSNIFFLIARFLTAHQRLFPNSPRIFGYWLLRPQQKRVQLHFSYTLLQHFIIEDSFWKVHSNSADFTEIKGSLLLSQKPAITSCHLVYPLIFYFREIMFFVREPKVIFFFLPS
jgi:hypothetical protein